MYYYHTNDEIDEIGEGIIRKYNYQAFIQGDPTDIEGFIADHLNYRIVYDRLADKDAGRMAFLADGKSVTPLNLAYFYTSRAYSRPPAFLPDIETKT